jgi:hypothetical protein
MKKTALCTQTYHLVSSMFDVHVIVYLSAEAELLRLLVQDKIGKFAYFCFTDNKSYSEGKIW